MKRSPWPERVGATGVIVEGAGYPWSVKAPHEVVLLLDDDPLPEAPSFNGRGGTEWTCVVDRANLEWADQ